MKKVDKFRQREKPSQTLQGTYIKTRKPFGFLIFDNSEFEDLFIPPAEAQKYLHGDRLEVDLLPSGEVTEFRRLSRRLQKLIAQVRALQNGAFHVQFERKNSSFSITLAQGWAKSYSLEDGDWVLARIDEKENRRGDSEPEAIIEKHFGQNLPASEDVALIAYEFGWEEFPSARAIQEAEAFDPDKVLEEAKSDPKRRDLTALPLITIDGETARDFDDAIHVKKTGSDYCLWVAIADVSHFVRSGTALDDSAFGRGTSVYFPEKAFHMLPRPLSENLCSLVPHVPRLALVAELHFNAKGDRTKTILFEATMQSKRRATYNEIEKEKQHFPDHFELFEILKKRRIERGTIDFELPEYEFTLNEDKEPVSIELRERKDSHRLIEEFMIAANEAVTEWALERKLPFLYRIHEEPDPKDLAEFIELARSFGIDLKLPKIGVTPKDISGLLDQFAGHPLEPLLNSSLLRSMRQAVYSSEHGEHFVLIGLQTYRSFHKLSDMGKNVGLPENHAYFKFLGFQAENLYSYLGLAVAVSFVLSFGVTLFLSHKLAGPLVRMKNHFRDMAESGTYRALSFRKGDFFVDLPPVINDAIDKVSRPDTKRKSA